MRSRHICVALLAAATAVATLVGAPVASAATCQDTAVTPQRAGDVANARASVLCLVNRQRTKHHLRVLTRNPLLQKVGVSLAADMVRRDYFDHTTPDGKTFSDRLQTFDWQGSTAGENIAWGNGDLGSPAKIVDAWMHSPGHRANILNPKFTRSGVGIAVGAPEDGVDPPAATYAMDYDRP